MAASTITRALRHHLTTTILVFVWMCAPPFRFHDDVALSTRHDQVVERIRFAPSRKQPRRCFVVDVKRSAIRWHRCATLTSKPSHQKQLLAELAPFTAVISRESAAPDMRSVSSFMCAPELIETAPRTKADPSIVFFKATHLPWFLDDPFCAPFASTADRCDPFGVPHTAVITRRASLRTKQTPPAFGMKDRATRQTRKFTEKRFALTVAIARGAAARAERSLSRLERILDRDFLLAPAADEGHRRAFGFEPSRVDCCSPTRGGNRQRGAFSRTVLARRDGTRTVHPLVATALTDSLYTWTQRAGHRGDCTAYMEIA
jgi:hypothetical protein